MGLGLAVGYPLFLALAVQKVPAIHAAVVIALVPAATAVLSAARNSERLPRPFWLACLTGLVAVTGYAAVSGGGSAGTSDLWLAAAVLSCAVGYVEGARVSPAHRSDPRAVLGDAPASPGSSPAAGRRSADPPRDPIPATAWAGLGYLGVISMFAASLAWYRGLAAGGTARIGRMPAQRTRARRYRRAHRGRPQRSKVLTSTPCSECPRSALAARSAGGPPAWSAG